MRPQDRSPKTKNAKSNGVLSYIALCFFAAFGVCFFVPVDIYMSNAGDIMFPMQPLLLFMGLITLAVFAVLFLICRFTPPGRVNNIFRAIVFGVSTAFYIQGNFLAVNMGQLDGSRYDLSAWKAAINIVIWLLILAVPFFILIKFPKIFDNVMLYASAAIILIQLLALGFSAYINLTQNMFNRRVIIEGNTRWACTTADLDVYSKNKNLIVIVTDMYDSFCFDSAVADEPDSVSEFDGFTYYANTVGKYEFTPQSFSYILTANGDKSYDDLTFFDTIAENFRAHYYCERNIPPSAMLSNYSDNILIKKISHDETRGYAGNIYKISFFRCMPEILKPFFQSSGDVRPELDPSVVNDVVLTNGFPEYNFHLRNFYDQIPRELQAVDEDVFKLIYTFGIHSPRTVTRDLEVVPESDAVTPEEAAIAVNKVLNEYLKILKDNGMYDNSEIIIMADHGIYFRDKFPLLMYKPAHQTETGIKISNAPISYDEMFPTLVMLAGGEPNGRTIFDIAEDEERERYFASTDEYITGNIKEDPQYDERSTTL